jgi:hypothetical protein
MVDGGGELGPAAAAVATHASDAVPLTQAGAAGTGHGVQDQVGFMAQAPAPMQHDVLPGVGQPGGMHQRAAAMHHAVRGVLWESSAGMGQHPWGGGVFAGACLAAGMS